MDSLVILKLIRRTMLFSNRSQSTYQGLLTDRSVTSGWALAGMLRLRSA
jgi:hypothetical protein